MGYFNTPECPKSVVLESSVKPAKAANIARVVATHLHQDNTLKTTMNLSNILANLDFNLI